MKKFTDKIWVVTAITLGVWEATAVTTKRFPTISKTCYYARQKHNKKAEAAIIAWLLGLGVHLLRHEIHD